MDLTTRYCGLYWSDGKFQRSVCGGPAFDNDYDQSCRDHDCAVASAEKTSDLQTADRKFVKRNRGKSFKRTLASYLVEYFHPMFYPSFPELSMPLASTPLMKTNKGRTIPTSSLKRPFSKALVVYDPNKENSSSSNVYTPGGFVPEVPSEGPVFEDPGVYLPNGGFVREPVDQKGEEFSSPDSNSRNDLIVPAFTLRRRARRRRKSRALRK